MSIRFTEIPVIISDKKGLDMDYLTSFVDDPELLNIILKDISGLELRRFCVTNKRIFEMCQASPELRKRLEDVTSEHFAAYLRYLNHAIAYITREGKLFVIGENKNGRLAIGTTRRTSKWIPTKVPFPRGVRRFRYVTFSRSQMGVITNDGKVYLSGSGSKGKLGDPTLTSSKTLIPLGKGTRFWEEKIVQLELYANAGKALTEKGEMWAWGAGIRGILPIETGIKIRGPVVQFADYYYLTESGEIYNTKTGRLVYRNEEDPAIQVELMRTYLGEWVGFLTQSHKIVLRGRDTGYYRPPVIAFGVEEPPEIGGLELALDPEIDPIYFAMSAIGLAVISSSGDVYYWLYRDAMGNHWVKGEVAKARKANKQEFPAPVKRVYVKDIDGIDRAYHGRIFIYFENGDMFYTDVGEPSRYTKPPLSFDYSLTDLVEDDGTEFTYLDKTTYLE